MLSEIIALGKRIYNTDNPRELHRFIVFVGRAMLHASAMRDLYAWYQQDEFRRQVLTQNPFPLEQVTRAFFYKGSTFVERCALVKQHMLTLQTCLKPESCLQLATLYHPMTVWHSQEMPDWYVELNNEPGQRKEGMLSLRMFYQDIVLYQVMFWLGQGPAGAQAMYIGALQGPNVEHARDIIKEVTKKSFRYRTKNLAIYMAQAVARMLQMQHIYAVTNEGYYAQNHVRRDRKLKTDFGEFWAECGGQPTLDERFYELPMVEPRKAIEDVKSQKRNLYRKRYAFLDDVDAQIAASIQPSLC